MSNYTSSTKNRTLTLVSASIVGILGIIFLVNTAVQQSNELVLGAVDSKNIPTPTTLSIELNGSDMYEKAAPTSTLTPNPTIEPTKGTEIINQVIQKANPTATPIPTSTPTLTPIPQPKKVEIFSDTKNGFAVKASDINEMDGVTFSIVPGDDTV